MRTNLTIKILGVILFLKVLSFAADPRLGSQVSVTARVPVNYVSEAVYQSSETCGVTNVQAAYISTPMAASLYAVNVTSAGTGDAKLELYDGGFNQVVTNGRRIAYIDTRTRASWPYLVSISSMLGINNQAIGTGAIPACVQIIYKVR